MAGFQITDWDNAYENGSNIVGSADIFAGWPIDAEKFRAQSKAELNVAYGSSERAKYDLFMPEGQSKGLFVFVHGGYWQSTDKSLWSHLARGAVDAGWAVLVPGYTLCPNVTVDEISTMVGQAVNQAAKTISGPIVLSGHSAGGHIVADLATTQTSLDDKTAGRVCHIVPIAGLFDLRPLINTKLNKALGLTFESAGLSSPALKVPLAHARLTAWVGGGERSEFLRQNALITNIWRGLGVRTEAVEEPDKHHFSVVEGLLDKNSPLLQTALAGL